MNGIRIQHLDLEGFRGVLSPRSLQFGGKSIVLFGENGTGKSTFVDALEKLFTGKVSTLDERAQGLSSQRHGPHIKLIQASPKISVTFEGPTPATFDLDTAVESLPDRVQSYLEAVREPVYILRRGQVLAFVESSPRDRYDLLRPFLPLSGVEAIEMSFGEARRRLEEEVEQHRREANNKKENLTRILGLPGVEQALSESEVLRLLGDRLKGSGRPRLARVKDIPQVIELLNGELSKFGDLARPASLTAGITALEELRNAVAALDAKTALSLLAALREREARETKIFYENVLEEGARWIEEEKRTECPLCEQEMRRFPPHEVVQRAHTRLHQMREILALRRKSSESMELLQQAVRSCTDAAKRAMDRFQNLEEEERREAETAVQDALQRLASVSAALKPPLIRVDSSHVQSVAAPLRTRGPILRGIEQSVIALRERLSSLPSVHDAQSLLELRDFLQRVEVAWREVSRSQAAANGTEALAERARLAHEAIQHTRKKAVGRLFDEISNDIDGIYRALHIHHEPEGLSKPSHRNVRLKMREAVQQSATLKADFYDRTGVDPRAYYSDAHLDTLGISIFLALRRWYRKQHPEFDLMVLDDVMTSVDTGHAVQLAELLLKDFDEFQILLTTHDRIWFEHLRDIQARCGVAQNFINKIIHKWTIEEGPDIREPEDERSQLERLIADGEPYEIASLAGRLLEHILQEMRYALRLPVQAKPGEVYEIGDLWPPFHKEVKKNFHGLYSEGHAAIDILDVHWPLRNWVGAHFNTWTKNVTRNTAVEFGRAVACLFDLVFCADCHRFVVPSATPLGQIACRCGAKIYRAPGKKSAQMQSREDLVAETNAALGDAKLDTVLHIKWKHAERRETT